MTESTSVGSVAVLRPGWAIVVDRIRLEQLSFWRDRQRMFFSFLMPVLLLVLLGQTDRHQIVDGVRVLDWLVPGLLTFGLAAATYHNLAVGLTEQRETGILKRLRATPLPTPALVMGHLGSSLIVGVSLTLIFLAAADLQFGIGIPARHLPAFAVDVVAGTTCFTALGVATATAIRSSAAAVPVANATYIPLTLISGLFFTGRQGPSWLVTATQALPMRPLFEAFRTALSPTGGLAFHALDLTVVAGWTIAGAVYAIRFFRWTPTRSRN